MAIDPKYANLPGIDTDSPDIYETSDLPESDQAQIHEEDDSEGVEKIIISADDAHSKFKGKAVTAGNVDFSDKLAKGRKTGYDVTRTEYEILGEGSENRETPQQKYQRLQHEIRELGEEVAQIKEKVKSDAEADNVSAVVLAKQVEHVQQQLFDLHLEKIIGEQGAVNLADPLGALQKRLITEIDSFKPEAAGAGDKAAAAGVGGTTKTASAAGGDSDCVTYQLYYRPEQAKFSNNARMADLDQRLERLEALLGTNPEKLSALTAETNNKSLVGAVATLSARTKLLDPTQISQIEGRMQALNHKLTQAAEKKEALENAERQTKVAELYDLVKKWDGISDKLPQIVDRLTALSQLHEQALQFSQALTHLDTAQQQIQLHLNTHSDMVKQVNTTLADNMTSIKSNFESLENRIKELK